MKPFTRIAISLAGISPDQFYFNQGKRFAKEDRWMSAIEAYREGLRINPKSFEGQLALAKVYLTCDRHLEAAGHATQAISLRSDEPSAYTVYAASLLGMGQPQSAIRVLREALVLNPRFLPAHDLLISLYKMRMLADPTRLEYHENIVKEIKADQVRIAKARTSPCFFRAESKTQTRNTMLFAGAVS